MDSSVSGGGGGGGIRSAKVEMKNKTYERVEVQKRGGGVMGCTGWVERTVQVLTTDQWKGTRDWVTSVVVDRNKTTTAIVFIWNILFIDPRLGCFVRNN